jgi:hypothetical protein
MKEQEVRKKVKALKGIYREFLSYLGVNAMLILIWATFDMGEVFWPKYVIVVWGFALIFKAYRLGLLPILFERLSFLTPEWEEKKINELVGRVKSQRKIQLNRNSKNKI